MSKYTSIDYPGWEQVDFKNMKWKFVQPGCETDYRHLKRVDAREWLITDDYDRWKSYVDGVSVDEGITITECIESHYQDWLSKEKEK